MRIDLKIWASFASADLDGDGRVHFILRFENRALLDAGSFLL